MTATATIGRAGDIDRLLEPSFIQAIETLGSLQAVDGSIAPDLHDKAERLLTTISTTTNGIAGVCGQSSFGAAFCADVERWRQAGLATTPDFTAARDAIRPPADGEPFFFAGPLRLANGGREGWRFETFLSLREEPADAAYLDLYERFPHPANICQSSHLVAGSRGLLEGNNIVFFPENIQAATPVDRQRYAVFFFNKFHRIFNEITLPAARRATSGIRIANPTAPDPRACYKARCVWGYLHDYFHHQGPRPFNRHVSIKTRWFTGLLEEIKVDLQSLLACRAGDIPDGDAVAEFILLDRAFRYPLEPDWYRNFDSGTGLILLAVLDEQHALRRLPDGRLGIDANALENAARHFIDEVEAIEQENDANYLARAKDLVRRYLPEGTGGQRFARPPIVEGAALALIDPPPALGFTPGELLASRRDAA
ncbi:DUF6421 family protein [Stappia sp.]|uniref:DUF6421 family protein n=1 Tax=Stappia sp. TaxID=1870903 RepID=UPI003A9A478E